MALTSTEQLRTGSSLTPDSETARLSALAANKRLYEGDLSGIRPVSKIKYRVETVPKLTFNWFRRIARFYPEFMFARAPTLSVEGNDRLADWFGDRSTRTWSEVQEAVVDGIAYGYGVLASHPQDPTRIWQVDPASHYEVVDGLGSVTADLIALRRGVGKEERVDLYTYPIEGAATQSVFRYEGGRLGSLDLRIELPPREGRQVVVFATGKRMESWYADIKESVSEIGRIGGRLTAAVERNTNPHMYGPWISDPYIGIRTNVEHAYRVPGAIEGGVVGQGPLTSGESAYLSVDGEAKVTPGYVTWDPKLDGIEFLTKSHMDNIYRSTGLSRTMFEQDATATLGSLSGVAVRRLAAPFYARLSNLRTQATGAVEGVLALMVANNAASGGERYAYEQGNVVLDWPYEDIFTGRPRRVR